MTHLPVRFVPVCLFGLLTLATLPASADAQQFYGLSRNMTYRPAYPVPFNFYSYQYQSLSGVNSSGPYSFSRYSYSNSPVPYFPSYGNYSNNYSPDSTSAPGSMGGGYGSTGPSYEGASPLLDRQRSALKSAQNNAKWNAPGDAGGKTDFDLWLSEQSNRREANNPMQPAIDIALINPNDEQLLSGNALNDLAARILALEAKGKKGAPGLCPPELLEKIAFAGGPAADALNRMHAAKLQYPEILKSPDLVAVADAFDQAYAPIFASIDAGKKVAPADIDRLLTVIEKARPMTDAAVKAATIKDASALLAFYSTLEAAAKYLRAPESVGAVGGKWHSLGVNVSDLAKHMQKYRVRFGRAAPGDDAAYGSMHRGMLAYYAALSQAK